MSEALINRLVEFAESGNQQKIILIAIAIKAGSWKSVMMPY